MQNVHVQWLKCRHQLTWILLQSSLHVLFSKPCTKSSYQNSPTFAAWHSIWNLPMRSSGILHQNNTLDHLEYVFFDLLTAGRGPLHLLWCDLDRSR